MANIAGKSYGLTAFTRMRPWRTWGLQVVFALIRLSLIPVPAWYRRAFRKSPLGRVRQVQDNLTELSFIHFARWAIVGRNSWPRLSPEQPQEKLKCDYLLFESNFNGDWEKYIDAFSQVVPGGMDNIWRWSVKYPMSRPITPFLAYIRNCQYDTDYYYSAYPGASTNDIRGALILQRELEKLEREAPAMTPAAFASAWARFCIAVQNCIATTGAPPYPPQQIPVRIPAEAVTPASAAHSSSTAAG